MLFITIMSLEFCRAGGDVFSFLLSDCLSGVFVVAFLDGMEWEEHIMNEFLLSLYSKTRKSRVI